jgi:hypothetical protein
MPLTTAYVTPGLAALGILVAVAAAALWTVYNGRRGLDGTYRPRIDKARARLKARRLYPELRRLFDDLRREVRAVRSGQSGVSEDQAFESVVGLADISSRISSVGKVLVEADALNASLASLKAGHSQIMMQLFLLLTLLLVDMAGLFLIPAVALWWESAELVAWSILLTASVICLVRLGRAWLVMTSLEGDFDRRLSSIEDAD